MNNLSPPHPKYRADIDGLRAIAVTLVVAFHAFPTIVKGGFIGVDIFFVISGFLISTIIFENLKRKQFSFIDFYSRRIKRIFPALLVMMALCLVFGWFALSVNEYEQLGKHVASGAGFISNYVLWNEKGYFDNASNTKILLHLWSLAIEEQFYIVWPLLLWTLWKCRFNAQFAIALLAFVSFYLNTKQVHTDLTATFYSPQTRFWELLSGAALAYWSLHQKQSIVTAVATWPRPSQSFLQFIHHIVSLTGAGLVCAGVYYITEKSLFPGKWALFPVVGCVLVIAAGPRAIVNRWLLANPILVSIGLISFPLYLFHWPLLTYVRIIAEGTPSISIRLSAVLASIALASLTYEFLEKPIRFRSRKKSTLAFLVAAMLVVACAGFGIYKMNGIPGRYVNLANDQSNRSWKLEGPGVKSCGDLVTSKTVTFFCAGTPDPTVVLIGDSHAGHLFYGFTNSKHVKFSKALIVGAGACQASLGVESTAGCTEPISMAVKLATSTPSVKIAVIGGYYDFIDTASSERSRGYLKGFQNTIDELQRAEKRVVFVIDNPTLKQSSERCYRPALKVRQLAGDYPEFCKGATEKDLKDHSEYLKFVDALRTKNPTVLFYDSRDVLCPQGVCSVEKDSDVLYGDDNHLSIFGSKLVVDDLIKHFEKLAF